MFTQCRCRTSISQTLCSAYKEPFDTTSRHQSMDHFISEMISIQLKRARAARRRFPFKKLPPEIRNKIYDLVFVRSRYIGLDKRSRFTLRYDARSVRNLAFAMSCRQVYTETKSMFYAKNGFAFYQIQECLSFLQCIGLQNRRLITKFSYSHLRGDAFPILRYLKSFTNLQELSVSARVTTRSVQWWWWEYPLINARAFFFSTSSRVEFEEDAPCGGKTARPEVTRVVAEKAIKSLWNALKKVKHEELNGLPPK